MRKFDSLVEIETGELSADSAYKLLTGCIVPRPIAWVTTISIEGVVNAAPFSAFTFLSNKPPLIGISIGRKLGRLKDTARNIIETKEFVVNIGTEDTLEPLHFSADEYEPNESEPHLLGIDLQPSRYVKPPRIACAPVSLECKLVEQYQFGDFNTCFYVGRVELFRVSDDLLNDGRIDSVALRPIARLGGPVYAKLGEIVKQRPVRVSAK